MKKLVMMLSMACLASTLYAQTEEEKERQKRVDQQKTDIKITKKINGAAAAAVGANSSTLTGDETNNKSLRGFHVGIGIPVASLSNTIGLRTELIYSQQGDRYSYGEGTYGGETISRLNYLNLPVMARYQNRTGFFAEAGLQPGLLLSAKEKRTSTGMNGGGGSSGSSSSTTDIKKDLNSFALGIPIGAGYVFKNKLALSARVTPGLLNVIKEDGAFGGLKERNFVLSARVSYTL